jgi:putative tryptophan/tyrosine transport system substrate-binding protein
VRRREFIKGIAGAAAAWPLAARAQQSSNKIPVVGVLWHAGSAEEEEVYLSVLVKAFNDLGYLEGKNIHLDHRFPAENPDHFRILARELVDERPDVIIAVTTLGLIEVKGATGTIPIVFVLGRDPVRDGFVESLGHPGGNATGTSLMTNDLSGKRLEILREAVPNLSRVALWSIQPFNPPKKIRSKSTKLLRRHSGFRFRPSKSGELMKLGQRSRRWYRTD